MTPMVSKYRKLDLNVLSHIIIHEPLSIIHKRTNLKPCQPNNNNHNMSAFLYVYYSL